MKFAQLALSMAVAVGAAVALAGPAQASVSLSGTVTYYSGFTEFNGVGITFNNAAAWSTCCGATAPGTTQFSQPFTSINDTADYGGTNSQSLWPGGHILFGADFVGTITVPKTGDYTFKFGVDDAAYVFVGGALDAQIDGGCCGNDLLGSGYVRPVTLALTGGSSTFELQYANEYFTQASVVFTAVPEPSTWAMLLTGFAGLGFAGYRASRKSALLAG